MMVFQPAAASNWPKRLGHAASINRWEHDKAFPLGHTTGQNSGAVFNKSAGSIVRAAEASGQGIKNRTLPFE